MTAPDLVVAGYAYPKADVLHRLPLRAFLCDVEKLVARAAESIGHEGDDMRVLRYLVFSSYEPAMRMEAARAKRMHSKVFDTEEQKRVRAYYSQTVAICGNWYHVWRLKVFGLTKVVKTPCNLERLTARLYGTTVFGFFGAICPHCTARVELKVHMYVDTGATAP